MPLTSGAVRALCVGLNTSDAELNNAAKLIAALSAGNDQVTVVS